MATPDRADGGDRRDSRRAFVTKAAYLTPVVLTFPTRLAAAQVGSGGASDEPQCLPVTVTDIDGNPDTRWHWVGGPADGRECFS